MFLSNVRTAFSKKKRAKPSFVEITRFASTLLETRSKFPWKIFVWKKIVRFSDSKKSPAAGVIPTGENEVESTVVYVMQFLMFVTHVRIAMNTLLRWCLCLCVCATVRLSQSAVREMFTCILIEYLLKYIHVHTYTPNTCFGVKSLFRYLPPIAQTKRTPQREVYVCVWACVDVSMT